MVGLGTYRVRECSRRRIHPLLNGEVSEVGSVRIGGVGGEKSVFTSGAVLRRPVVRTRTSTTPVQMGLGTYQERGCLEKRIFPLLNGEAAGVGSVRVGGVDGHEATGAVEVEGKTDAVAEGEEENALPIGDRQASSESIVDMIQKAGFEVGTQAQRLQNFYLTGKF